MTPEYVYDQLAYGELKNVVFGRRLDEDQGIEGDHMKQILPHVQLGLTDLHKRFLLREETCLVDLQDGQSDYWLTLDFATTNTKSKEQVKYIADTAANPFTGNLHKVEQLWGTYSSADYRVPLNRIDRTDAVRTPQYNKLIVPTDSDKAPWLLETTQLKVVYRADHPPIREAYANAAASQVELNLPLTCGHCASLWRPEHTIPLVSPVIPTSTRATTTLPSTKWKLHVSGATDSR
jgi:hypothetical protein